MLHYNSSPEIKSESYKLIEQALLYQKKKFEGCKYFITSNEGAGEVAYTASYRIENNQMYVVEKEGSLLSIERVREGRSDFLHPECIEKESGKWFTVNIHNGKWLVASSFEEVDFEAFKKAREQTFLVHEDKDYWNDWLKKFKKQ